MSQPFKTSNPFKNFTSRPNDSKHSRTHKNPFLNTQHQPYTQTQTRTQTQTQTQTQSNVLNINDTEQFPCLPSTKKIKTPPNSPETSHSQSWSMIAKNSTSNLSNENDFFKPKSSKLLHNNTRYSQQQESIRRELQKITEEQLRRDILNEELGEDSPYWGSKSLFDNDSDGECNSSDLEDY
jgi:hypothetical protein